MCLPHDYLCEGSSNLDLVAEQVWDKWMLWRWVSLLHLKRRREEVEEE